MKKRMLSMVLALAMLLSLLTVGASAAGSAGDVYYLATETYYANGEWQQTTTNTYDSNGNILQQTIEGNSGINSVKTYTYDSNENVLTIVYTVDALGYTRTYDYTYDSDGNRLTEVYTDTDGGELSTYYTYDGNGNVLTEVSENSAGSTTTTYTYDDNGNVLTESCGNNNGNTTTTTYDYDSYGNLLSKVYKNVYTWVYDGETYKETHTQTTTYTYSNGNLVAESYKDSDGNIKNTTYEYDSNGNLVTEIYKANSSEYNYYITTYTYDDDGNMLTVSADNGAGDITTTTYTYDENGNMLSKESPYGKSYTYTYISLAELQSNTKEEIENPFTDVQNSSSWYYNAVMWAVEEGITNGTTDTTFSPTKDCTRAEIVTFLWRAAGCPEPTSTENPFTDVKIGKYYYKAVLWAVEKGITTGTSSTTFSPNASCTRAEAVTFIYRYAKSPSVSASDKFTDVSSSKWYTSAVAWAVENSITSGTSSTTFSPNTTCSRAMIVTFLYRYCA